MSDSSDKDYKEPNDLKDKFKNMTQPITHLLLRILLCASKPSEILMVIQIGMLNLFLTSIYRASLHLVHICRQNPQLSIDKSPILSVDCCGTKIQRDLELFVKHPHLQLVYEQSQNFVY